MNRLEKQVKASVVVASVYSTSILKRCLDSILAGDVGDVEIIVARNLGADETPAALEGEYKSVRFIEFGEKATLPELWAAGIARSTGEIVAITDSSCVVAENWITEILAAHRSDSVVVGGAVEMSGGRSLVDWAAYFCEYGQFMPPLAAGAAKVLPGNNIAFKRDALEKHGRFVQKAFWKTYLCRQLQAEGIELIAAPSMLVYYSKSFELLPFLARRFHHGRCFAGMRIERESVFKRALYASGTIFLPAVFFIRTIAPVLRKKRFVNEFLLSLPISVLAILFWSFGEFCGYLAGTGKSCEHIY